MPRRAPGARVVAAARALDLDHVGAEVAERHRRERAREHAREVGDEQPVERSGGVGHRPRSLVSDADANARRLRPPPRLHARRRPAAARRPARAAARGGRRAHDRLRAPRRRARAARGAAARRRRDRRAGVRRPRPRARPGRRAADRRPATTTTGSSRAGSTAACRPSRPASSASSSGSRPPTPARWPRGSPSGRARRASRSPTPACGCATTSTRSTATTSTCHTTVADLRAPGGRRDGALGRAPARARRLRRRLRGRAGAALRVDAHARPALAERADDGRRGRVRARLGGARRARGGARIRSAPPRSAPAARRPSRRSTPPGVGPIDRNLSAQALRRGGLLGMREVLRRLDVTAPWVLFGHSHRAGPWPRDDRSEWTTAGRHAAAQHGQLGLPAALPLRRRRTSRPTGPAPRSRSSDDGPPELIRLLGDRTHDELRATAAGGEAGGVAGHAVADLELEQRRACGAGARRSG